MDLAIFDAALSYTADPNDINCITIVELKRPQRNDLATENLLKEHGVKLVGEQKVTAFTDKGVATAGKDWNDYFYDCDTIVTAFGLRPNDEYLQEFMTLAPEVYPVGDVWYGEKSIGNANLTAFNLSMDI